MTRSSGGTSQCLQTLVLMIAVVVITVNLAVDIAYAYIDPRIRYD